MSKIQCQFCFSWNKIPFKDYKSPTIKCKNCEQLIQLQHDPSRDYINSPQTLTKPTSYAFSGPFGTPWPVFWLLLIHHCYMLLECYFFIQTIIRGKNNIPEILSLHGVQIIILMIIVCGFHFRLKWFWSLLRTICGFSMAVLLMGGILVPLFVILDDIKQLKTMLYIFIIFYALGLTFLLEYLTLGLASTRAWFGFLCPKCQSLRTKIPLLNIFEGNCMDCMHIWKL